MVTRRPFDVFLSHATQDGSIADVVVRALTDAGFAVVRAKDLATGEATLESIRTAMVESRAVVVLFTSSSANSANLAFEVGAALAWQKPVFVLTDGGAAGLVGQLRSLRQFPVSSLDKLVDALRQTGPEMREQDRHLLTEVYQQYATPVEDLLSDPQSLDAFGHEFNKRAKLRQPGERLAGELLRLRKSGRLPVLRQKKRQTAALR